MATAAGTGETSQIEQEFEQFLAENQGDQGAIQNGVNQTVPLAVFTPVPADATNNDLTADIPGATAGNATNESNTNNGVTDMSFELGTNVNMTGNNAFGTPPPNATGNTLFTVIDPEVLRAFTAALQQNTQIIDLLKASKTPNTVVVCKAPKIAVIPKWNNSQESFIDHISREHPKRDVQCLSGVRCAYDQLLLHQG